MKSKDSRLTTEQPYISRLSVDEVISNIKSIRQPKVLIEIQTYDVDYAEFGVKYKQDASWFIQLKGTIQRWEGTKTRVGLIGTIKSTYLSKVVRLILQTLMVINIPFCATLLEPIAYTSNENLLLVLVANPMSMSIILTMLLSIFLYALSVYREVKYYEAFHELIAIFIEKLDLSELTDMYRGSDAKV